MGQPIRQASTSAARQPTGSRIHKLTSLVMDRTERARTWLHHFHSRKSQLPSIPVHISPSAIPRRPQTPYLCLSGSIDHPQRHYEQQERMKAACRRHGFESHFNMPRIPCRVVHTTVAPIEWIPSSSATLAMPRELITLQVGQCGNQVGRQFWQLALEEHAKNAKNAQFDESMSTFFRNVDTRYSDPVDLPFESGKSAIRSLKARAILVDMEQGPVSETLAGPLGELFDQQQFITDVSGAGNNWAHGHCVYGPKYRDELLSKLHRAVELCDSLQSFFLIHSIGGGTGSGLGTYILGLLEDHYPEVYRFTTAIFPSEDDDVITSPYNSILSLHQLTEHADCVLPIENEALADLCAKIPSSSAASSAESAAPITEGSRLNEGIDLRALEHLYRSGKAAPSAANQKKKRSAANLTKAMTAVNITSRQATSAFGDMNNIVARLLTNLTSSMRFEGALNVDLNEITTNLVPYPKLHFLLSSMSPVFTTVDPRQQPRRLTQMFSDAFSRDHQLIRCNPRASVYLACGLLLRGNVEISDVNANIQRLQSEVRMIHWNQEGFKVGLCSVPPVGYNSSLLCLSNNCCIRSTFERMHDRFRRLYTRKAHLHHYTEYMDADMLAEGYENVKYLINEYSKLEEGGRALDTASSDAMSDKRRRLQPLV